LNQKIRAAMVPTVVVDSDGEPRSRIDEFDSEPVAVSYMKRLQFLKLSKHCNCRCEVAPIAPQFMNDLALALNALLSLSDMPFGQRQMFRDLRSLHASSIARLLPKVIAQPGSEAQTCAK
jgi:hypothetical protein